MKITQIVLYLAFIFSGVQSLIAEQEATGELLIGSAPTLGDLTGANVKLLNPDRQFDRRPPKSLSLNAEPTTLILKTSKAASKPIHFDQLQAIFDRYPVDAGTPISSLDLITTVDSVQFSRVANDLGNVFKLKLDKLNVWVDNQMWEETEGFEIQGSAPNTSIQLYVGKQRDQKQNFVIRLSLRWKLNDKPQQTAPSDGDKRSN